MARRRRSIHSVVPDKRATRAQIRDPYAAAAIALRAGRRLSLNNSSWWLWIPAFAGKTRGRAATKQSILPLRSEMDCFAEPVIGRRFAPTRWLEMTNALLRRRFARGGGAVAAGQQSQRQSADRQQRDQPLDADGAHDLQADGQYRGIGKQAGRSGGGARGFLGAGLQVALDLLLARHVQAGRDQRHH